MLCYSKNIICTYIRTQVFARHFLYVASYTSAGRHCTACSQFLRSEKIKLTSYWPISIYSTIHVDYECHLSIFIHFQNSFWVQYSASTDILCRSQQEGNGHRIFVLETFNFILIFRSQGSFCTIVEGSISCSKIQTRTLAPTVAAVIDACFLTHFSLCLIVYRSFERLRLLD